MAAVSGRGSVLLLVLLVGAGLLLRSFVRLARIDPGFDVDNVLTATVALPGGRYAVLKHVGAYALLDDMHDVLLQEALLKAWRAWTSLRAARSWPRSS